MQGIDLFAQFLSRFIVRFHDEHLCGTWKIVTLTHSVFQRSFTYLEAVRPLFYNKSLI